MKQLSVLSLLLLCGLVFLGGCKQQPKPELAQVPPPPDPGLGLPIQETTVEPVLIDPVVIEPVEQAPIAVDAAKIHTIQKGDTLWSISRRHFGSGQRWQEIVDANPGLNAAKLPIGQAIVLP
jgi:nucleoid-associated protein YgaU